MKVHSIVPLLAAVSLLAACAKTEPVPPQPPVAEETSSSLPEDLPVPPPPSPQASEEPTEGAEAILDVSQPSAGEPMPADLQAFVTANFSLWIQAWGGAAPAFDLAAFARGADLQLAPAPALPAAESDAATLYLKPSPDGRLLGGASGGISEYFNDEEDKSIFLDLDSLVATRDPAAGTTSQLDATGPCCSFTEGAWLDADTLVVVGDAEYPEPEDGQSACPEDDICSEAQVYVYHLSTKTRELYRGVVVTADARDTLLEQYWQMRFPGFEIL